MDPSDDPLLPISQDQAVTSNSDAHQQSLKDKLLQRKSTRGDAASDDPLPPGSPPSRDLLERLSKPYHERDHENRNGRDRERDGERDRERDSNRGRGSRWDDDRLNGRDGDRNDDRSRNRDDRDNGYGNGYPDGYAARDPRHPSSRPLHFQDYSRPPPPTRDGQRQNYNQYNLDSNGPPRRDQEGPPPPGAWGRRGNPLPQDPNNHNRDQESGSNQRRVPLANVSSDSSFFASRDAQRKNSTVTIWPRSPERSWEESEEERERKNNKKGKSKSKSKSKSSRRDKESKSRSKSRKHSSSSKSKRKRSSEKRKRYDSDDESESQDDDSDPYDDRESSRKSKSKRDSDRGGGEGRSKEKKRRRKSSYDSQDDSLSDSDSEDDDKNRGKRSSRRSSSKSKGKSRNRSSSPNPSSALARVSKDQDLNPELEGNPDQDQDSISDSDSSQIGPSLPKQVQIHESNKRHNPYGQALLAGEGEAMAQFASEGQRIPRRGEIGVDSEQIEKYEKAGFVMSGSRHRRMNAVSIRKENQIISAEERRGILKLQAEEREKREREIVGQFKELLDDLPDNRR